MDSEVITLSLKQTKGSDLTVSLPKDSTVETLKREIQKTHGHEPARMRLIYRGTAQVGRILKDADVLSTVGVSDKSVLHMVLSQGPPAPAAPPPAQNIPMQTGAGEMAGLLGALNTFGGMQQARQAMDSLPDPGSLGMDMGGMDPAAMQAMLQNPFVRQMMEQMLANDSFLDMALSSNPAMQGYMQQHPEIATAMRDPMVRNMMRQQLQRMFSGSASGAMSGTPGSFPAPGQASPPPVVQPGQPAQPTTTAPQPGMAPFMGFNPFMFMQPPVVPQQPAAAQPAAAQPPQQPFFNPYLMNPYFYGAGAAQPATPPREMYRAQLQQMREMGFINEEANLNALQMCGGNVQLAIEYLLRLMG